MSAQNEGNAALVLELPASTRALGLGNAFALSGNESDGLFYNPALLEATAGSSFSIGRYGTAATLITASSSVGGFGFGVQAFSYATGSRDLATNPVDLANITSDALIAVSEMVATLGYGRELLGFRMGLAAKWIHQRVNGGRAGAFAADVGVLRDIGFLTVGGAVQHVGPGMTVGGTDLPLPTRIGFGAATDVEQVGPLDVVLTTALFRQHDGGIMAGGGLEVAFWPIAGRTFTGRIGVIHEPNNGTVHLTFGGAVTLDNATGGYGFHGISAPGSGHYVGIGWQ